MRPWDRGRLCRDRSGSNLAVRKSSSNRAAVTFCAHRKERRTCPVCSTSGFSKFFAAQAKARQKTLVRLRVPTLRVRFRAMPVAVAVDQ